MFFFFSSRRRHTRFDCDWSSDVCSSDLLRGRALVSLRPHHRCSLASLPPKCAKSGRSSVRRYRSRAGVQSSNRSEEHTSELQSQSNLVCRLLLEKKKNKIITSNKHVCTE